MANRKRKSRLPWPIVTELSPGESWRDPGRDYYLAVLRYLELAEAQGLEPQRTPVQRHRLARRAAQVGFLKVAFEPQHDEIARAIGVSQRTVERAIALLARAYESGPPSGTGRLPPRR